MLVKGESINPWEPKYSNAKHKFRAPLSELRDQSPSSTLRLINSRNSQVAVCDNCNILESPLW